MTERFIFKAHHFINGCSGEYAPAFSSNKLHPCSVLKKGCNEEDGSLNRPRRVGLETFYATLLILTMEQLFSAIKALLKDVSNSNWSLHFEFTWVYRKDKDIS